MTSTILQASQVTKIYRTDEEEVVAVRGVDLSVAAGDFVAVMGPSGCGKSTLLHLLGGITRPTSGTVSVAGADLSSLSDDALAAVRRDRVGFVFQAFNLVPVLDVVANVALPLRLGGRSRGSAEETALVALERVGLRDRASRRPAQLSGGEQQRVAIARAIAAGPSVVLADEPTGNLDSSASGAVVELLRELNAEGQTIVVVTHDAKVASNARRVVFMQDGAVVRETSLDVGADPTLLVRLIDSGP